MTSRLFSFACAAFFLAALTLGGASRHEVITADIVAVAGLPLLAWAIWRMRLRSPERSERFPFLILAGCFLVGLVQLIPLPPALWTALPGRAILAADLIAAGVQPGWAPISLTPYATWGALLSLVPAAALFLATRTLDGRGRHLLILVGLVVGVLSAVVGGLQVAGGPESPLRFYAVTNPNPAVGFFANRNHLASLLVCLVPFAAIQIIESLGRRPVAGVKLALMLGIVGLAIVGAAMTQSRAAILLLALAIPGSLALAWRAGLVRDHRRIAIGLVVLGLAGAAALSPLAFAGALDRFDGGVSGDLRFKAAKVTAGAIVTYAPVGSGLGTFVPAYMAAEPPSSLESTYINHAHNDWLEVLLEGGLPALAVLVAFLIWYGRAALRAWRPGRNSGGPMARAASLVIALLLVHSLVDYPLRTPAMMCVFAFACGLMISPRPKDDAVEASPDRAA